MDKEGRVAPADLIIEPVDLNLRNRPFAGQEVTDEKEDSALVFS